MQEKTFFRYILLYNGMVELVNTWINCVWNYTLSRNTVVCIQTDNI